MNSFQRPPLLVELQCINAQSICQQWPKKCASTYQPQFVFCRITLSRHICLVHMLHGNTWTSHHTSFIIVPFRLSCWHLTSQLTYFIDGFSSSWKIYIEMLIEVIFCRMDLCSRDGTENIFIRIWCLLDGRPKQI